MLRFMIDPCAPFDNDPVSNRGFQSGLSIGAGSPCSKRKVRGTDHHFDFAKYRYLVEAPYRVNHLFDLAPLRSGHAGRPDGRHLRARRALPEALAAAGRGRGR
jgi:hypothetical protein